MLHTLTSHPFGVLWRSALVRAPRLTPISVLKLTDPQGPLPVVVDLPSRGDYKIPVYIFIKPNLTHAEAEKLPVVLDFHGGGFYLGSCLEQAPFCSKLARDLGAAVLSVDYRMGPISKFPAAIEDAEDVLRAVLEPSTPAGLALREAILNIVVESVRDRRREKEEAKERKREEKQKKKEKEKEKENSLSTPTPESSRPSSRLSSRSQDSLPKTPPTVDIDPTRIAISGFSSGGNLALNLALSLTEPNGPLWPSVIDKNRANPIPFLLYYPSFDARQLPSERRLPEDHPQGSSFWAEVNDLLVPTYLPRDQAGHLRASPGLADVAAIHEAARMLLVLPEKDSLAEQSEAWVKKIQDDGTRSNHLRVERYKKVKHGWTQFPDPWLNKEAKAAKVEIFEKTVDFVRRIWDGDETALQS